jgi:hypothetical protein
LAPCQTSRSALGVRIAVTALALGVVLVAAPAALASRTQVTMFQATRELRSSDARLRNRTFDEIQALGVGWIRVNLYWHDVAPNANGRQVPRFDEADPAAYPPQGWVTYDRIIDEARRRGMRVRVTISGPVPRWATRRRRDTVSRPSPKRFERFVTAVGRRYARAVGYWSVWNEPNHPDFLKPQFTGHGSRRRPYSPRLYRQLFRAARTGLERSGNTRDRLIMGETAPRGTPRVVAPLAFLRGALCLTRSYRRRSGCGRLDVDGWAHHPYTTSAGPWFVPREADDVTIGTLSRLQRALDRAGRVGAVRRHLGIYLTEFGVQSRPDPFAGVSETRQAEYRCIGERIAWKNPRVRAFSQYLMRDDLPRPGRTYLRYGGFESGLRHSDGNAKRAYDGFRLPLVARRVGRRRVRVHLWGLVRPADGRTTVRIERRARGSGWLTLKQDRTDERGYWTTTTSYEPGRSYRVRWRAPDGHIHTGPPTRVYRR